MLGLGKLRYKASTQDIRKACKLLVYSATVLDRKIAAKSNLVPDPNPGEEGGGGERGESKGGTNGLKRGWGGDS